MQHTSYYQTHLGTNGPIAVATGHCAFCVWKDENMVQSPG